MIAILGRGKVGSALARSLGKRAKIFTDVARIPAKTTTFLCIPEEAIDSLESRPLRYVTVSGSKTEFPFPVRTFHPLMGFTARRPRDFTGVPVAVEGTGMAALARSIGALPFAMPKDRTLYHAAAVLAGAGVLTTWAAAGELITKAGASPEMLLPIALAALHNGAAVGVRDALTGPVVRGDEKTILEHRRAIKAAAPDLALLYDVIIKYMRRAHR